MKSFLQSILAALFLVFLSVTAFSGAAAQTFTDNSFSSGWATSVHFQNPAVPLVSAAAIPFPVGTPNSRRLTHNYFGSSAIYVRHINSLQTYSPSSGQISTIQFRYTARAASINVGYAPLIEQGGQYYSRPFDGVTSTSANYNHLMTANNFWLVRADGRLDETRHPDFSCSGAPIRLGYYTGNSNPDGPISTTISSVSFLSAWRVDIAATPCAPSVNPCCPPVTTASVKDQLRLFQPGMVGSNFTFFIIPSAPYTTQFQAYVNYLNAMNPAITTFTVDWVITDQGTGTLPTAPAGPTVATAANQWTCTASGCPPAMPPLGFAGLPLTPNRWYRVTATPRLNNGLSFWPADCPPAIFEYNMREIP
jgi:hypothetical protein